MCTTIAPCRSYPAVWVQVEPRELVLDHKWAVVKREHVVVVADGVVWLDSVSK